MPTSHLAFSRWSKGKTGMFILRFIVGKNIEIMKEFKGKKSHAVSVRMTPMERMLIESRAKETGMSMSSYMVLCSLGKELRLLSQEEKTAYKHLATYHSHFSRIGNLVRKRADISTEVSEVVREIKKQLVIIRNGE